jgi:hypothetical protein
LNAFHYKNETQQVVPTPKLDRGHGDSLKRPDRHFIEMKVLFRIALLVQMVGAVNEPVANGQVRQVHGTIVSIYQHDPDGWHLSLMVRSVPARRRPVLDLSSEFSERQHSKTSSLLDSNS